MSETTFDPSTFGDLALAALRDYPVDCPAIRFLRHSENLTFEVTEQLNLRKYLLRLHYPRSVNFITMDGGLRQRPEAIRSELLWLEVLGQDGTLKVQKPACNRKGELVTLLSTHRNQPPIPVTLLQWIDGDPLLSRKPYSPDLIYRLGVLSANLRKHSAVWQPLAGFIRPVYAREYLQRIEDNLAKGVSSGAIQPQDFSVIQQCLRLISEQIEWVKSAPDVWGLVHADFHPGNVLVSCEEGVETLCPIDFSLCGFSDYLWDVGPAMITLPQEMRMDYLRGYRSICPVGEDELYRAEGLAMASFLSYCALVVPIQAEHEWLQRRIPRAVTNECQKLLRGESFLFTM